jgi:hypothetical protein
MTAGEGKLYRIDIAKLAGVSVNSLDSLRLPDRDGTDIHGSHARPFWWASTAEAWLAARPGKGWRAGRSSRPRADA